MGLTPDQVPAELRQQIYQKLGLDVKQSAAEKPSKKAELVDMKILKKQEEKRQQKR